MNQYADLVFFNGEVITVNGSNDVSEAVAVKDNKILFVGSNKSIEEWVDENTIKIDLKGNSLLPGFIDSHIHLLDCGLNEAGIDCSYPNVKSIDDIKSEIRKAAENVPSGTWIMGVGYNQSKLTDKRHPNCCDLDSVTDKHPVILFRICGHMAVCNSAALSACKISEETEDPVGGKIERGSNGKLTGLLYENAAYNAAKMIPITNEELMEGLITADRKLTSMGITTVHDAGGYGPLQNKVIQDAFTQELIHTRIYTMVLPASDNEEFGELFLKTGLTTGFGNEQFKIGTFKVAFIDGSSSAPTAAVKEPYCTNLNDRGMLNITQDHLNNLCINAHKAGYQVTAHAVGDKAIEMFLDAIELAQRTYPRENCRHRIEHCAIVNPQIINRIKNLKMIPVAQPHFIYEFGDGYLQNYGKRTDYMFACKSFIETEIISAGSSDSPVASADPILGIHAAVNRQSETGENVGKNQRVSIMDAIRLYTINGAYASFEENIKGSLEINKLADMVVLSGPILKCRAECIKEMMVEMTMVDGKIVYERSSAVKKGV